jgi:ATP-dependent protease ClpP protease subunit
MHMQVARNQLIFIGNVVGDEPGLIADILSKNPATDTVILRNSRGGDVAAGYRVGEMFRARSLRTAVSGY